MSSGIGARNDIPLSVTILTVPQITHIRRPGIGIRAKWITLHHPHLVPRVSRIEVLGAARGVCRRYAPTGRNAQRADARSRYGRYPPWHRTWHRAPRRSV